MRTVVTKTKLRHLLREFGRAASGAGTLYLTGGGSALLHGWRDTTVDVDLKFDPEPPGVFEMIPKLKEELGVNIELASLDHFIPEVPGWRDRSPWIERFGHLTCRHYDFVAQALAKIERGHGRDLDDVEAMMERGLVQPVQLREAFSQIKELLIRYPAIDPIVFEQKVDRFLSQNGEAT